MKYYIFEEHSFWGFLNFDKKLNKVIPECLLYHQAPKTKQSCIWREQFR